MSRALEKYLDRVMIYANRRPEDAAGVRAELQDHLEAKVAHLMASGVGEADAVFQAIEDHGPPRTVGYMLRPRLPLIDVRTHGTARGVVAVGPRAVGVFAFGGVACGLFAFGGVAIGLVGMGGLVASLFFAWGAAACVPLGFAFAAAAAGVFACGGLALGVIASGGLAAGLWVPGAARGFSYFAWNQVPDSLRSVGRFLTDFDGTLLVTFVCLILFVPLFVATHALGVREARRVRRLDPALEE